MPSENPHPLHETNAERLERASGGRKPILRPLGWPSLIAAALLLVILVIIGTGYLIYRNADNIFRNRQDHLERIEKGIN